MAHLIQSGPRVLLTPSPSARSLEQPKKTSLRNTRALGPKLPHEVRAIGTIGITLRFQQFQELEPARLEVSVVRRKIRTEPGAARVPEPAIELWYVRRLHSSAAFRPSSR